MWRECKCAEDLRLLDTLHCSFPCSQPWRDSVEWELQQQWGLLPAPKLSLPALSLRMWLLFACYLFCLIWSQWLNPISLDDLLLWFWGPYCSPCNGHRTWPALPWDTPPPTLPFIGLPALIFLSLSKFRPRLFFTKMTLSPCSPSFIS